MAAPASTGMEKAEMRKMLMHTKEKPVHCAIGMGKDQAFGLLLMDKMKAPKMLEKQLIDSMPDAKNTRWGTAAVDWENDPKLVKLFLNKPVSSMARRLVKTLKGTGFTKVQIMMDDGTVVEGAADEEDEAAETTAAPAAAAATAAPPPPPPRQQAPALDAAELTRRLAALAPRIAQAAGDDAERKAELMKLATQGNVNIKTNNLTYAATFIEQLARALDAAPPPAQPAPPAPPPPAQAAPARDPAELARMLAALAPRIPQAAGDDANRKAAMLKLATDANVNIKTNNLTYAATFIEQLRRAIEGGPQPAAAPPAATAPAAPPAAGPVAYAKSRLAWLAARKKMEGDIDTLRREIVATYQDAEDVGELESSYRSRVSPLLTALDESLADKLDEATNATEPAARAKLVAEAKAIITGYQQVIATEPLIADLDDNPFVKLTIAQTMNTTLTALAAAIH